MSTTHVLARCLSALLSVFMVLQSSGCNEPQSKLFGESSERSAEQLSDDELFREILFPNAASAERVPEIGRIYSATAFEALSTPQREAAQAFEDLLVERVQEEDPEFVAHFAAEVTSGDVQRVDAVMTHAHGMIRDAVGSLSTDLEILVQEGNTEALGEQLSQVFGQDSDIPEYIENLDPHATELLLQSLHEHLQSLGIQDPSLGIDVGVQTSTSAENVGDPHNQAHNADLVEVETAIYIVLVAIVAVAIMGVLVVVVFAYEPVPGLLNGESGTLFRDQMIANITLAYAR